MIETAQVVGQICKSCAVALTEKNWSLFDKERRYYCCKDCERQRRQRWYRERCKKREKYCFDETRSCRQCGINLTKENWTRCRAANGDYVCTKCSTAYTKKRHSRNRVRFSEYSKQRNWLLKGEVMRAYGGKCACCSESALEFLTIDHVNGGGGKHRKKLGVSAGISFYRWLRKQGFPKDEYQVLCYNCNCARGFYGVCPHKRAETITT